MLRCPGQRPGPSPGTNSPQDCLCPGSVPRPATRASSFYLRNCVTPHPTAAPLGVLDEEAERRASGQWGGPDAQVKEEGRVADRGTWSIRPAPLSAPIRSTKSMNGRTAQVAGGSRPALRLNLTHELRLSPRPRWMAGRDPPYRCLCIKPLSDCFRAAAKDRTGSFSAIHQLPVGPRVRPAKLNRPLNCPSLPGPRLAASLGVLILPRIG